MEISEYLPTLEGGSRSSVHDTDSDPSPYIEPAFKANDPIICINSTDTSLIEGHEYTVTGYRRGRYNETMLVYVSGHKGAGFSPSRFKLAKSDKGGSASFFVNADSKDNKRRCAYPIWNRDFHWGMLITIALVLSLCIQWKVTGHFSPFDQAAVDTQGLLHGWETSHQHLPTDESARGYNVTASPTPRHEWNSLQ